MLFDARVQVARTFGAQVAYGAVDQLEAGLDGAAAYVGQLLLAAQPLHVRVRTERQVDAVHLLDGGLRHIEADELGQISPHFGGKRELAVGKRPRAREPRRDAARLAAHARARGPAQLFGTAALAHREPLVHHDDVPRMSMLEQRQRAEYARRPHADDDDVRCLCAHERPPLSCCLVASRTSCAERCAWDGAGAAAQAPVPPL